VRATTLRGRIPAPFATAALALAAAAALCFVNPNTTRVPLCPLHAVTGLNCPLCGATRASYALLHGDLLTAAHDNALYVAALPFLLAGWLRWSQRTLRSRGRGTSADVVVPRPVGWTVVLLAAVFFVVRNVPVGAWFAPV
jgi:hypothetical protein